MALNDLIAKGVALADKLTGSLQSFVTIRPWTSVDGFGEVSYGAGVKINAIIEPMDLTRNIMAGEVLEIRTKVLILEQVPPNGAAGREEPIDPRDLVVLPNGTVGIIVGSPGMLNPTTERPYFAELVLGPVH